jgi:CheY-like chemotaxis protein
MEHVGTIMLVDDEKLILDVGQRMIQKLGYEAITAQGGEQALALFNQGDQSIDLVILDMIMPGLSGGDTFDRLKALAPETKVILSSGYSLNGEATAILERGCNGFIQKPFNMKQLGNKISEVLKA